MHAMWPTILMDGSCTVNETGVTTDKQLDSSVFGKTRHDMNLHEKIQKPPHYQ